LANYIKSRAIGAPSAARTTTANSNTINVPSGCKGMIATLNITAASGTTPTLDVKVQRFDSLSGQWVDLTGAAFAQMT
jgi:hypothetical protein